MHFVIHCLDHEGAVEKRLAHYEAHRAYLANPLVTIVISGPLLAVDNETMIGSCFLVEAESLEQVEAFNRQDPFFEANLWKSIAIHPFLKRMDNRS